MSLFDKVKSAFGAAYKAFYPEKGQLIKQQPTSEPGDAGAYPPGEKKIPRSFDYRRGQNTEIVPRQGEGLTFRTLRNVADRCELVGIAVQMRKDQIRGLAWDITVEPGFEGDRDRLEVRRNKIRNFFQNPDPLNDLNFHDWIAAWLEDLLVIDAATIYYLYDRAGRLVGLPQVDGATIKPLITENGYAPKPPSPAYVQVLQQGAKPNIRLTRDELLYSRYNPRPNSVYGRSPVEMILTAAHISLKRELGMLAYWTEGNIPEHLLIAPEGWTPEQILTFQGVLDDYLAGNATNRSRMHLLPAGSEPKAVKASEMLTNIQADEWLARIIGAAFSIAPHLLLRHRTKQYSKGLEDQQSQSGLDPLKKFISEVFTKRIVHDKFNEPNLQFSWLSDKRIQARINLETVQKKVPLGITSIDEVRESEGNRPYGLPAYIQFSNGLLWLTENVLDAIRSGKADYVTQEGTFTSLKAQEEKEREERERQAAAPPAPSGDVPPSEEPVKALQERELAILVKDELSKWQRAALSDLKNKRPMREFTCLYLDEDTQKEITELLKSCSTQQEAKQAFQAARAGNAD